MADLIHAHRKKYLSRRDPKLRALEARLVQIEAEEAAAKEEQVR